MAQATAPTEKTAATAATERITQTEVEALLELRRPTGAERPPTMARSEVAGAALALVLGPVLGTFAFPVDLRRRMAALEAAVVSDVRNDWTRAVVGRELLWPPSQPPAGVLLSDPASYAGRRDVRVARAIGLDVASAARLPLESLNDRDDGVLSACLASRRATCAVLVLDCSRVRLHVAAAYITTPKPGHTMLRSEHSELLPEVSAARFAYSTLVLALALLARAAVLSRFRRRAQADYDARAAELARATLAAEAVLGAPMGDRNRLPQRVAELDKALAELPRYRSSLPLRLRLDAERCALIAEMSDAPAARPLPRDSSRTIAYLRVLGTPFAYRAPDGWSFIRVGRHRGNDFVVRVPDSDHDSLKLSRTHVEIQRSGARCIVLDRSSNGTSLRGARMPRGTESLLDSGDIMVLGGVLSLEFIERADVRSLREAREVRVEREADGGQVVRVDMMASVGSMVTVVEEEG